MFGKIFDQIVIEKQGEMLGTSELQFGYKTRNSNVMCSTIYSNNGNSRVVYYVSKKISSPV